MMGLLAELNDGMLSHMINTINCGQVYPRGHSDIVKFFLEWWDTLIAEERFWEAQMIYKQLSIVRFDMSSTEVRSMVYKYFRRAQESSLDIDSTQIALSALTQQIVSTKARTESDVINKRNFTFPEWGSRKEARHERYFMPWNDAVSCAIFGTALVDTDRSPPSVVMSYYFRQSLEMYLPPTILPPQSQPLPIYRAAALEAAIAGDADLLRMQSGEDWQEFASFAFLRGAKTGNLSVLRVIPAVKRGVYSTDLLQRSALHLASINSHCRMVQQLLELEADPNAKDWFGSTPLHYASGCKESNQGSNAELIRLLCLSGADLNAKTTVRGRTPLHIAARCGQYGSARQLLELGASTQSLDNDGSTPLNLAITHGPSDSIKLLFAHGASVDSLLCHGRTVWHVAGMYGFFNPADLPLHDASIVDSKDDMGYAPLHVAALNDTHELVSMLCRKGANVDIRNTRVGDDKTALHLAARAGHAIIVKTLLEHGTSVDIVDKYGKSPLHIAAREGHAIIVKTLLEHGASVDIVDKYGKSPLQTAAGRPHADIIQMLLEHGASVDIVYKHGESPLHIAASHGHNQIAKLLIDRGASLEPQDSFGGTPLHVAVHSHKHDTVLLLLNEGAVIDSLDNTQSTPLHYAVKYRDYDIAKLLRENGARTDVVNAKGETPMELATSQEILHMLESHDVGGRRSRRPQGSTAGSSTSTHRKSEIDKSGKDPRFSSSLAAAEV